jgi:hypothetical protein
VGIKEIPLDHEKIHFITTELWVATLNAQTVNNFKSSNRSFKKFDFFKKSENAYGSIPYQISIQSRIWKLLY